MKIPYIAEDLISIGYESGLSHMTRYKVFGGWLVKSQTWLGDTGVTQSMVFVPDQNHEWEI